MDDDFNTALAIGTIFELIRMLNKYLDGKPSGSGAVALVNKAEELLKEAGSILNIFSRTPEEWNKALMRFKCPNVTEELILSKIEERQKARGNKDWAAADAIRKELEDKGVVLEDKKEGTAWKVKV
jgi:cysteinyl-tRNA synthetase